MCAWPVSLNFVKCGNKVKVTGTDYGRQLRKGGLRERTFYCKLMTKTNAMKLLDTTSTIDMLDDAMCGIGELAQLAVIVNGKLHYSNDCVYYERLFNGTDNVRRNEIKQAIMML